MSDHKQSRIGVSDEVCLVRFGVRGELISTSSWSGISFSGFAAVFRCECQESTKV